jgi:thiol-disulfide isomerase/thioredoxin
MVSKPIHLLILALFVFTASPVRSEENTGTDVTPIAVGAKAPTFSLKTLNPKLCGLKVLSSKKALSAKAEEPLRALVLSFGASYCKPCKRELPELKALAARLAGRGVLFTVVVRDKEPEGIEAMRKLTVDELALPFPVVSDRFGILARRYGAEELPFLVVVGADGVVRMVRSGFSEGTMSALEETLAEMTGGEAAP